jgi:hypothetical protein
MAFNVTGQMIAETLHEYRRRWGSMLTSDFGDVLLDFHLDDYVDALCLRLADNPGLPVDSERVEIRALLSARLLVLMANGIIDPDGDFLSCPTEPSAELLVGAVFGRLVAAARLPDEWNGRGYLVALEEIGMKPVARPQVVNEPCSC